MGELSVSPTQSGLALSPRNLAPPHVTPHILATTFQKDGVREDTSPTCVCKCDCVGGRGGVGGGGQWGDHPEKEATAPCESEISPSWLDWGQEVSLA